MRVVFLGNAQWSVASLEALAASSHELALVATREARPAGRGNRLLPTPVSEAARRLDLPLREVRTVKSGEGFEALAQAAPDVLTVVAYGEILPQAVLDLPRRAPVNLHFSLLPELRGAAPLQWAILEGLQVTGVTTIRMDAGMDTGPILLQAEEAIDEQDDAGSLGERLAAVGGRLLVDTLDRMEAGVLREEPQDDSLATYAPKLTREDEVLDWAQAAEMLWRRVRALSPSPGAVTRFRGRGLKVFRVSRHTGPPPADGAAGERGPGTVLVDPDGGLAVVAREGWLTLEEVQPEGGRRMSGADFVRGHRPRPGEAMGGP